MNLLQKLQKSKNKADIEKLLKTKNDAYKHMLYTMYNTVVNRLHDDIFIDNNTVYYSCDGTNYAALNIKNFYTFITIDKLNILSTFNPTDFNFDNKFIISHGVIGNNEIFPNVDYYNWDKNKPAKVVDSFTLSNKNFQIAKVLASKQVKYKCNSESYLLTDCKIFYIAYNNDTFKSQFIDSVNDLPLGKYKIGVLGKHLNVNRETHVIYDVDYYEWVYINKL